MYSILKQDKAFGATDIKQRISYFIYVCVVSIPSFSSEIQKLEDSEE